jgi:hypothetical protein
MKNKLVLIMLVIVMMAAAMPVYATSRHDRFTRPNTISFVLAQCDGFDVIQQRDGWVTFTDYYDNQGNLTNSRIHAISHESVYNSESGFEVKNTFAYNRDVSPDGTEYFIRGVANNITVPGYGIVFFDSGLGIFVVVDGDFVEVKFSGKYEADEALICEAMNQ